MTLSRAQAATELAARAGAHLRAAGLLTTDTTGNLKEPLDDTFRALGVTYSGLAVATVAESDLDQFLAVGTVYVLRAAVAESSKLADVAATTLGTSKRQNQITENLERALVRAESAAMGYGVAGLVPVMTTGCISI